ncbi:MAG: PTS cellobiose transporter subunit IIC [Negativicutes bacterium]|nr:PTS cellobiose transporter subunit IIC [Negativicutes bacterium]
MRSVTDVLQDTLLPVADKITNQRYLDAIRFGFVVLTPFFIVGSVFLILANLPIPGYDQFMEGIFGPMWDDALGYPVAATYGIMAIWIVGPVAYRLADRCRVDALPAAVTAGICFLIITPFGYVHNGEAITGVLAVEWLGSKGLFAALFISLLSAEIYSRIMLKGIVIKMPEGVPPMVSRSFASLIPAGGAIVAAALIRWLFMLTPYGNVHSFVYNMVAIPLQNLGDTLFGAVGMVIAITLLWTVGLNGGSIMGGITTPILFPLQMENLDAYKQGLPLPHIITPQFFDLIWMGGAGATITVVFLLIIRCRARQHRELGKLALGSGLFNINEPILFGLPIVLNPFMLIPFSLVPMITVLINYFAMDLGWVARPTGAVIPWTTPPLIQGYLITGDISGAILQLVDLAIGLAIYWPFISILDKQRLKEEEESQP